MNITDKHSVHGIDCASRYLCDCDCGLEEEITKLRELETAVFNDTQAGEIPRCTKTAEIIEELHPDA